MNLKNLVQESRALTNHILPTGLTPLDRGLEQIESQTKRLLKRSTARDSPSKRVDNRTAYLLASRGIDTDKVFENLVDLKLGLTFEPLRGVPDTDIEQFLRNEHETLVSLAIEESRMQTVQDFEASFEKSVQKDWARQKRKIMENMGQHSLAHLDSDVPGHFETTMIHTGISGMVTEGDLHNNPRLEEYASVIKKINDHRLKGEPFNVISAFRKASANTTDRQQEQVSTNWDLLSRMLGIHKGGAVNALHFQKTHSEYTRHENNQDTIKYKIQMIKGSREWLQDTFRSFVTKHVREQRFEIGGMPSVHTEVDAYIKIKFHSNGRFTIPWLDQSIGRVPFWAHVFMLVRMGLNNDAMEYVHKYENELRESKDVNFISYFKAWINSADGRLPKNLRDSLIGEWNARIRDYVINHNTMPKGDAFKYALYKIIGRCELNIKTVRCFDVLSTTEDYIWFQTLLISEKVHQTDAGFERYTFADFSMAMQKVGKDYFKKTEHWFMVLLCCGQFEKAVNDLANEPFFSLDALHFAVALAYLGVLKVPENPRSLPMANTLLSSQLLKLEGTDYMVYEFHFARMVALLVKDWVRSNPVEMMQYIYLIGIFGSALDGNTKESGKEYTRYIHTLTKDILTQSAGATALIGQLREDGKGRIPGPIEHYRQLIHLTTDQEFLDRIVLSAAEQCDKTGRLKEALEYYNLSMQPNKVLELLTRQISEILQDSKPEMENPIEMAQTVLNFYMSRSYESSIINQKTVCTLKTLISVANFRKEIESMNYDLALQIFYQLDLIPTQTDMNSVQKKAQAFNSLDEQVCRIIPKTLVELSGCLSNVYGQIKNSRTSEKEHRLVEIKQKMKAVLMFCGMVQYQIPGDMFAKMNRLDVMMC